ncbi:hypothetical protein MAR_017301 [Mya arenaria]|uniref:Uncharacterized protein n=1 Tax=Mya arenaria TaxID=6604 RepID=A0ABY7EF78_MYAAR|nr:hypothetical protein MAR_017301 [Mya arenaria]
MIDKNLNSLRRCDTLSSSSHPSDLDLAADATHWARVHIPGTLTLQQMKHIELEYTSHRDSPRLKLNVINSDNRKTHWIIFGEFLLVAMTIVVDTDEAYSAVYGMRQQLLKRLSL